MSHPAAMAWTSLGVTLRWRLPATLAALCAGTIDLYRARLIGEAAGPLDDDTARAVDSQVLPRPGGRPAGSCAPRCAARSSRLIRGVPSSAARKPSGTPK